MWESTLEHNWGLKKSCQSQGPAGGEMWAPALWEFPALFWWCWAVDHKCWHFRRRSEKLRLEHAAENNRKKKIYRYFCWEWTNRFMAVTPNLQQGMLPPSVISDWKTHAGMCCMSIPPLSYIFESSAFNCHLKWALWFSFPTQWLFGYDSISFPEAL